MRSRGLRIREQTLGPEHPDVGLSYKNLAHILYDMGDLKAALPLFERTLLIYQKAFGADHPRTADAPEQSCDRAGKTRRGGDVPCDSTSVPWRSMLACTGPDHPEYAGTLLNLGMLLKNYGDYSRAKRCFEQARPIFEKASPPESVEVARSLRGLAAVLQHAGERGRSPYGSRAGTGRRLESSWTGTITI